MSETTTTPSTTTTAAEIKHPLPWMAKTTKKVKEHKKIAPLIWLAVGLLLLLLAVLVVGDPVDWYNVFGVQPPWIIAAALILIGAVTFKTKWLGKVCLLAGVMIIVWNFHAQEYRPLNKGIFHATRSAENFVATRADEIKEDYLDRTDIYTYTDSNGKIRTDPNKWFEKNMGGADEIRDDGRRARSVIARAKDEDERIPQAIVKGSDADWVTVSTTEIPTHVTVPVDDKITPPWRQDEKTNADGRTLNLERHPYSKTVLMYERAQAGMPMENVGQLDELIGRFCSNGVCGPGFPMGTDSVLCVGPGLHQGGTLQVWRNGLRVQGQVAMLADFAAAGKYNLHITPDDPSKGNLASTSVCQEFPGALVVKKHKSNPTPATTLVASR